MSHCVQYIDTKHSCYCVNRNWFWFIIRLHILSQITVHICCTLCLSDSLLCLSCDISSFQLFIVASRTRSQTFPRGGLTLPSRSLRQSSYGVKAVTANALFVHFELEIWHRFFLVTCCSCNISWFCLTWVHGGEGSITPHPFGYRPGSVII